jgi:hypothetical protein
MSATKKPDTAQDPQLVASGLEALADVLSDQYPGVTFTPSNGRKSRGARTPPGAVESDDPSDD